MTDVGQQIDRLRTSLAVALGVLHRVDAELERLRQQVEPSQEEILEEMHRAEADLDTRRQAAALWGDEQREYRQPY